MKPNTARARLDADRTAEPLTRIVHHPPHGGCIGPYMPLVEPEYVDENGGRTPLGAEANEQKRVSAGRCKRGCNDQDAKLCWPLGTVRTGRPCSCACHPVPVTLAPSEVALAKMFAAWFEWTTNMGPRPSPDILPDFGAWLLRDRWISVSGSPADKCRDLLARARKAGVL